MPTPKGGYHADDGERVPSFSSIASRFKEAGGLIHWSSRLAFDPLSQAKYLAENGGADEFLRGLDLDACDYRKVRDKAADAGTCGHDMFDCFVRKREFDPSPYTPEIIKMAEPAFLAGKEWAEQSRFEVIETEVSLVSERYRFGGTRDAILVNGKRSIGDVKTSKGVFAEYLLQLAAYAILDEEHGNKIDGGFHLLRFSKQEKPTDPVRFTHYYWSQLDEARRAFLLMRELYDLMKGLEKLT